MEGSETIWKVGMCGDIGWGYYMICRWNRIGEYQSCDEVSREP